MRFLALLLTIIGSTRAMAMYPCLPAPGSFVRCLPASGFLLTNQQATRYSELAVNGTDYAAIKAPASLAAPYTLTLPPDDGASGEVLRTDGSGVLSWATVGAVSLQSAYDGGSVIAGTADIDITHTGATARVFDITHNGTGGFEAIRLINNDSFDGGSIAITQNNAGNTYDAQLTAAGGVAFSAVAGNAANGDPLAVLQHGGTGVDLRLSGASTGARIEMYGSTSGVLGLKAPAVVTSYTLTLPADDGNSGEVLRTDGAGVTTWVAQTAAATLQSAYNGGSTISGTSNLTYTFGAAGTGDAFAITNDSTSGSQGLVVTNSDAGNLSATLRVRNNGGGPLLTLDGTSVGTRLRMGGSTAGTLGLTVPATVTSHTLTLPSAQGAASTFLQNNGSGALSWTAQTSPSIGGTLTSATAGSVLFAGSGTFAQDNASLFFDDTNNRLGIGTASPATRLEVVGSTDVIQTQIRAHSTQTADIFNVESSAATDLFTVQGDGAVTISETGANGGNVPHAYERAAAADSGAATCTDTCAAGERVVGGGCDQANTATLIKSYPSSNTVWSCEFTAGATSCIATAICFQY